MFFNSTIEEDLTTLEYTPREMALAANSSRFSHGSCGVSGLPIYIQ